MSPASLYRYERGETPIPSDVVERICDVANIRSDWLLLGRGPRHADMSTDVVESASLSFDGAEAPLERIPVLSEIPAGFTQAMTDGDMPPGVGMRGSFWVPDPRDPNAFGLVVKGNSMSPTLSDGDIIVVSPRRFDDLRFPIAVIKVRDEEVAVKYLRIQERHAILISENPQYDPVEVPLEEIHVVGRVIGWFHQVSG